MGLAYILPVVSVCRWMRASLCACRTSGSASCCQHAVSFPCRKKSPSPLKQMSFPQACPKLWFRLVRSSLCACRTSGSASCCEHAVYVDQNCGSLLFSQIKKRFPEHTPNFGLGGRGQLSALVTFGALRLPCAALVPGTGPKLPADQDKLLPSSCKTHQRWLSYILRAVKVK